MRRCESCQRPVPDGKVGYRVRIEIWADDGGYVSSGSAERISGEEGLNDLMDQIARRSIEDLEDEVHQVLERFLCAACRRSFLARPLGYVGNGPREHGEPEA